MCFFHLWFLDSMQIYKVMCIYMTSNSLREKTGLTGQGGMRKGRAGEMEKCVQHKIHTCMKMSSCNTVPCTMNIHNGKQIKSALDWILLRLNGLLSTCAH